MKKVKWLIQTNLISNEQVVGIAKALAAQEIAFDEIHLVPFTEDIYFPDGTKVEATDDHIIPYGSNKLVKLSVNRFEGVFFDKETFRLDTWIANRSDMLNDDAVILTLPDALIHLQSIDHAFVRPVEDLKAFPGVVVDKSWNPDDIDISTEIAISSCKNIVAEWRYFIVNGVIISGSLYRLRGKLHKQLETDSYILEQAQILADRWLPHPTCVMDVAYIDERGYRIIEFNCFNCSGFYDHDLEKIVKAASTL